jgi:hypothetical protein
MSDAQGQAHGQIGRLVAIYAMYRPRLLNLNQCFTADCNTTEAMYGVDWVWASCNDAIESALYVHASMPPSSCACPAHFYPLGPDSCMMNGLLCYRKGLACRLPQGGVVFSTKFWSTLTTRV